MSVGLKLFSFRSRDNSNDDIPGRDSRGLENSGSFWKKTTNLKFPGHVQPATTTQPSSPGAVRKVYGAQHPPKYRPDPNSNVKPLRNANTDEILAYQRSMHGDIEDEFQILENKRPHSKSDVSLISTVGITPPVSPTNDALKMEFDIKAHFLTKMKFITHNKQEEQRSAFRGSGGLGYDPNDRETAKLEKFGKCLAGPNTDINTIRNLSWNGIPGQLRATTWQILCGYLPTNIDRREATLTRKRQEYLQYLGSYYTPSLFQSHSEILRQIQVDVPRTNPDFPLFQQKPVQESLIRVLFIWSLRHPASGYVQGINDLLTPFFVVFLTNFVPADKSLETVEFGALTTAQRNTVEADTYWCVSYFLEDIQDNYTFEQPGIQLKVASLRGIIQLVDNPLHQHLLDNEIEYMAFAFRWMNNLLMREFPLKCIIRLWDTYLSEKEGFAEFHLYTCAAFLLTFSQELRIRPDMQSLIMFLQKLPTGSWDNSQIEVLLAKAYQLKYTYENARGHLPTISKRLSISNL